MVTLPWAKEINLGEINWSYLLKNGIGTLIQWGGKGVHQFKSLGYDMSLPFSENVFNKMLLLPINMTINDDDINFVCGKIKSFYGQ